MKLAMEEWRHWLEGTTHPFIVLTDHKNLEYLRSAKRLNPRQARWALFFTRFQFTVTYRPGTKNTKADALSRQTESVEHSSPVENILPAKILLAPVQWDIITEITHAKPTDSASSRMPRRPSLRPRTLPSISTQSGTHKPQFQATLESQLRNTSCGIASGGLRFWLT